jgi:hypothetical protein
METWKECGWAQCRKRFVPTRRSNQHHRANGAHHEGAVYCSRSCQQKAYRWRLQPSRKDREGTRTQATVTRPEHHIENTCEIRTKNGHPRPLIIAGPVESYSERSLRAASLPLDPATAESQRRANDWETIRRETAWGTVARNNTQADGSPSDWKPCLPSDGASLPDLPIPEFFRRVA